MFSSGLCDSLRETEQLWFSRENRFLLAVEARACCEPTARVLAARAGVLVRGLCVAVAFVEGRMSGSSWNFGGDPRLTVRR
jgi:hypothetical protein